MNKNKILIVDDSKGWLDYHQDVLKKIYGDKFLLETADSARSGYDKVYNNLSNPYSLVISDLQMELDFEPKHAGEWFIEQVQKLKEFNNVPIIIVSASYNVRTVANRLGVSCLPKASAARDLNSYKLSIEQALQNP